MARGKKARINQKTKRGITMGKNYYLHKNKKTGEVLYLEYDKIKGYPITPKTKIEDAIEVHKIIFANKTLQEKLVKKKVEIKLRYFIKKLEEFDTSDDSSSGEVQNTILEAERLRINILNRYVHYLGNTYASYTLSKIQVIINQLKVNLYQKLKKERYQSFKKQTDIQNLYYLDEEEPKKGRGR